MQDYQKYQLISNQSTYKHKTTTHFQNFLNYQSSAHYNMKNTIPEKPNSPNEHQKMKTPYLLRLRISIEERLLLLFIVQQMPCVEDEHEDEKCKYENNVKFNGIGRWCS